MVMRMGKRGEVGKQRRISCRRLRIGTEPVLDSCSALLNRFLFLLRTNNVRNTKAVRVSHSTALRRDIPRTTQN